MIEGNTLQKIKKAASVVRETYERFRENPPPSLAPELGELINEIGHLAAGVEELAGSPVKIGVVGEFNAGKTLLLGSLIGYADALPVSDLPTTGNVTALEFTLVDDLATTELGPFEIEYLDDAGVDDCLRWVLEQARVRADTASLRSELQEQLRSLDRRDLAGLERWCHEAWAATNNPNLRYLIRELVSFIRGYARCGPGMCTWSQRYTVEAAKARQGLTLEAPPRNIQGLGFDDLPPAPPAISTPPDPGSITADQIRASFPLIRRIRVKVRLSKKIWDFSGLAADNQFVLLDFPGLGAATSSARDMYLCWHELAEVQTILILLNGDRPGGAEGANLYDMMQSNRPGEDIRDTILVGVGRFDKLPLDLKILQDLAGSAQEQAGLDSFFEEEESLPQQSVTEKMVLEQLPILKTCIAGAEALPAYQHMDRIILLSPLLHLKRLGQDNPTIQVCSPEFLPRLQDEGAEKAVVRRKLWETLSRKLEAQERKEEKARKKEEAEGKKQGSAIDRAGLTRWLADFSADGGVSRLRQLIQSHVQEHGLDQLYGAVVKKAVQLKEKLKLLRGQLMPPDSNPKDHRTPEDRLEGARKRFSRLAEVYQNLSRRMVQAPALSVERNGRPVSVNDIIREEVIFRVYEWSQWNTLLQASENDYITDQGALIPPFPDEEEDEGEAEVFPMRSEDFLGVFEQTVQELEAFTRAQVAAGVDYFLSKLADEVVVESQELGQVLQNQQLTKQIQALKLGPRGKGLVGALRVAIDPKRLKAGIFPEGDPAKLEIPLKPNPNLLFPLARSTRENLRLGQVFAWNKKLQEAPEACRPERHQAHQAQVLRLRKEFVTTLSQEMAQLLSVATQLINEKLKELLKELNKQLSLVASNDVVLDTLLRDQPTQEDQTPATDPLAIVRQMAVVELPI